MATLYWIGHAPAVSQVTTATVAGSVANQTFTLTVGNVDLTYVANGSDTATDIAQAMRDLWNNSTHPYHMTITASEDTGVITLTADIAGVPFTVSSSATGSATFTTNTTTVNSGPNDWSTAENWSTQTLPIDADVVIFEHSSVPVLYGLDQSAITLSALHVKQSFTGKIGLDDSVFAVDADTFESTQREYRQSYLAIGADSIHIGEHAGMSTPAGSGRIKIDSGTVQTQLHVYNTATTSSDTHQQVVRWKGTQADNVLRILRGKLGIATNLPGEQATVNELYVGQSGSLGSDANVVIGEQVTLSSLNQAGGAVTLGCDVTSIEQLAGSLITIGNLVLTDITVSGQADFQHIGNINNLTLRPGGEADFSHQSSNRTITNCQLHNASTLNLANGNPLSITFTNGLDYVQTSPENVSVTWWPNVRLNVSAIA